MARPRKRKSNKRQLSFKMGMNDERIPKLFGVLLLFFALYLFIAFTSYLFTWKHDQHYLSGTVWQFLLSSGNQVDNWLGRLGVLVSDFFFRWLFGLPSYLLVLLLAIGGISTINRTPFQRIWKFVRNVTLITILLSVIFEFFAGPSSMFPWGGAVGEGISGWLVNFVGKAGTVVLFFLFAIALFVWAFNPSLNDMKPNKIWYEVTQFFQGLIYGKKWKQVKTPWSPAGVVDNSTKNTIKDEVEVAALKPNFKESFEINDTTGDKGKDVSLKPSDPVELGEQLKFELDENGKRVKKESLKTGDDSALEINDASDNPTPEAPLSVQQENKGHIEPYDPTLELSMYENPVLSLLEDYADRKIEIDRAELERNKDQIIETLLNYKIEIIKIKATIGPTVTLYEIVPAPGVRISKIKNLEDDIALSLAALGIRIIAPIPGKGTIGIEVPNRHKQIVSLKEVLQSEKFINAKMDLPIALGKTISNEVFVADLAKMPHLLIAGATGQGKSVGINTVIMSLLYKKHPSQVKLVLIDPKKVELFPYSKIDKHFLSYLPGEEEPITTETNKVVHVLNSLCIEMDQRYDLLKRAHTRNLREYNKKFVERRLNPLNGHKFLPYIVLVIDEFADLIMTAGKEVELPIGRLAQLARAVGIHLIIATQRPSVNIITGVIKANFPARIAFKVTSKIDSRTILDAGGAEQLIGMGDMLLSVGADLIRLQCAFVDTPEVERVLEHIASQKGYPQPYYLPEFHGDDEEHGSSGLKISEMDENFQDAARMVVQRQSGSTSMLQRSMKLGYNRAGRIMDQLEAVGIVGPARGSKPREVLFFDELELMKFLENMMNKK
jgi:S-DNA-T family DNA segregation ATPase FtsK/SpoIIIE